MVKMTKQSPSMAIPGRIRTAALSFSVVLALGAFARSAAEPRSPVDGFIATVEFVDHFAPESASVVSRAPQPPPLAEHGVADIGSDSPVPAPVTIDAALPDAWAEAFAAGSRLPFRPRVVEVPPYPVVVNPQVQYFLDLFTGSRREVVNIWVSRSGRYLGMIRDVLRSRGLPEELAFTAMIESGFKPDAVSRVGAKGMWQFMAPTARRYGLRVDSWVDERYDPEKSTVAAARYLSDLYGQFGSWSLAQAAYNAGEMKVARAIRKTGSSDFWTLAESRHLRRETKDFVPQIHAATVIGRDPDRYGFEFDDDEAPAFETVKAPGGTDLRRVASAAGLPFQTLRSLNRVLVRGVTPPGAAWELRVPAGSRDTFLTVLAPKQRPPVAQVASARGTIRRVAVVEPDVHVVRPKDTLISIARQYGVSVGDVVRWNSIARQDRIRPGDRLRVALRPSVERDGQGGFR
jgi:membrane-bound lytic murein transglycosylase D